ncbi:bifunctional aminoglycoside phosphotransferase/ATP-binding protein [Rhodococcus tukisamuensis]|uniref:AAA domain-containing protein n=1 Tax=Rhodococcus tukisamuensis TaxID=168276 RepID=A0A1G6UE16_9NOCA|nr:bifunctional aminoglycoside phosphotransferase/ATP-binding protein [Rhodococcus tukisamuensis]SDD38837.1 hypothetical protein SAMN05444580_104141 [Rhodococcus tukisamuensis]
MSDSGELDAQIRETHTGVVVLVGNRAYKGKKPVRTAFLDFSTHELRELACRRELELNTRLAPDIYLGVVHLVTSNSGPREPVLLMRRLPDAFRLSALAAAGDFADADLLPVVEQIARFHATARRGADVDREGSVEAVGRRWQDNIDEIGSLPGDVVSHQDLEKISSMARRYLDGRAALFERRVSDGNIVDGHGDLMADDIFCLPDGPRILDCLDFDDRLRFVDRIDDTAFLAMDLEFLGRHDLADATLAQYRELAGDEAPASLAHHYVAYRALVRAKVDCVRSAQRLADADRDATRHFALALGHLGEGAVRLALVGGLPGTGKSTLSEALAEAVGAVRISSDEVRRQLRDTGELSGEVGVFGSGLYSPASTALVYSTLRRYAEDHLRLGHSVVLDASWTDLRERERARVVAERVSATVVPLECHCPRTVAATRIRTRTPGWSDATVETADRMAAVSDLWGESARIDTARPLADSTAAARRIWAGAPFEC